MVSSESLSLTRKIRNKSFILTTDSFLSSIKKTFLFIYTKINSGSLLKTQGRSKRGKGRVHRRHRIKPCYFTDALMWTDRSRPTAHNLFDLV